MDALLSSISVRSGSLRNREQSKFLREQALKIVIDPELNRHLSLSPSRGSNTRGKCSRNRKRVAVSPYRHTGLRRILVFCYASTENQLMSISNTAIENILLMHSRITLSLYPPAPARAAG
jgi:hypothetical protein